MKLRRLGPKGDEKAIANGRFPEGPEHDDPHRGGTPQDVD